MNKVIRYSKGGAPMNNKLKRMKAEPGDKFVEENCLNC